MSTGASADTFEYDLPSFVEPVSFGDALERTLPGSVVSREGHHFVLRDIDISVLNTRSAIDLIINPPQSL